MEKSRRGKGTNHIHGLLSDQALANIGLIVGSETCCIESPCRRAAQIPSDVAIVAAALVLITVRGVSFSSICIASKKRQKVSMGLIDPSQENFVHGSVPMTETPEADS